MVGATWATADATRKQVERTPTTGVMGSTACINRGRVQKMNARRGWIGQCGYPPLTFTALGKNLFVAIPTAMGARTTLRGKETSG
jgi:hypothetical protein